MFGEKKICKYVAQVATLVAIVPIFIKHEKIKKIQLFEFQEVGTNLFHFTILNLARFLIEVNDSEGDFQIIDVSDAWSILTKHFLYDSTKKMFKVLESLDQ